MFDFPFSFDPAVQDPSIYAAGLVPGMDPWTNGAGAGWPGADALTGPGGPAAVAAAARTGNPFGMSEKDWQTFYAGLRGLGGGATGAAGGAPATSMPNSANYQRAGFAAPASAGGSPNLLMSMLQMHANAAPGVSRGRMSLLGG